MERMEMDLYDQMHFWKAYRQSPSRLKLTSFSELKYSRLPPRMVRSFLGCSALRLHTRALHELIYSKTHMHTYTLSNTHTYTHSLSLNHTRSQARSLFYQVCKALDYLHERPILHRDLSWGNIMFKADAQGRLIAKVGEQPRGSL